MMRIVNVIIYLMQLILQMLLWRQYVMEKNGNYDAQIQELSNLQSKLETCGNEYLKLVSEQEVLISTLLTQPNEGYRIHKKHLDLQLKEATCAMKSISLHLQNARQFVAYPPSTLKSMTSGKTRGWFKTWLDYLIMSSSFLFVMPQKK